MFQQHFLNYLLEKQKISGSQHALVREEQKTSRVKLGLIGVAEKLMTPEQADELNELQKATDRRFGDLAVEKGYLTSEQLNSLLEKQGNPFLKLVQILLEKGIFSLEEIEAELEKYAVDNHFSKEQLEELKSKGLDGAIPLLIRTGNPLADRYLGLVIRNVIRFIDNQPLVKKAKEIKEYEAGNLCYQKLVEDHRLLLGFASEKDQLLAIASPFAQEEFDRLDEDSFDSVCEFVNCVNGLFASKLSHEDIVLEIMPPEFAQQQKLSCQGGFYLVPLVLNGREIDLIAAVDAEVKIK